MAVAVHCKQRVRVVEMQSCVMRSVIDRRRVSVVADQPGADGFVESMEGAKQSWLFRLQMDCVLHR